MKHNWILLAITISLFCYSCQQDETGELVFHSVKIYDGSGEEPVIGDVLIENGKIKKVAEHIKCPDCKMINGKGRSVAPGFIDLHAHLEPLPLVPAI